MQNCCKNTGRFWDLLITTPNMRGVRNLMLAACMFPWRCRRNFISKPAGFAAPLNSRPFLEPEPHASGSSGSSAPDSVPSFHKRMFVLHVMIPWIFHVKHGSPSNYTTLWQCIDPHLQRHVGCHVDVPLTQDNLNTSWEALHHLQHRPASPVLVLAGLTWIQQT